MLVFSGSWQDMWKPEDTAGAIPPSARSRRKLLTQAKAVSSQNCARPPVIFLGGAGRFDL
jgi:hypothetical protein